MLLKTFTVSTIILISTSLISKTYGNLESRNNYHVNVHGNVQWDDSNVNDVIAVLEKEGTEVCRNTVKESPSSIYLTTFIDTKNEIDGLTVTFNYNLRGESKKLKVTVSDKCTYDRSNPQTAIVVGDIKFENIHCNLGNVYLG
uniref:Cystatin domain-containing protein n=1 Tax=Strongyloides papillosus TaxID=174720 RepID=A0A0N5B3I1_STREA